MSRYTKTDVVTGDSVKSDVNVQLGLIEAAIADTVSRVGDLPNTMSADLDMNSNQILNLPDAVTSGEPITLRQGLSTIDWDVAVADAKYYDTVALAAADATLEVGDVVVLKDRANGIFDVVTVGITVGVDKPNTRNIIVSTADATKCFVQRPPTGEYDFTFTTTVPGDFLTLQEAVDFYKGASCSDDNEIIVNIETGHALTAGLGVFNGDCSHIRLTSTDATVSLDASFVGVDTSSVPAGILALGVGSLAPLFFGYNCTFPQLDCIVDMGSDATLGTGYYLAEAQGVVLPSKGVINAGYRGAQIHGRCNMYAADFSGANGSGLRMQQASSVCARNAVFDNCCVTADDAAVYVSRASILEFRGGSAQGSGASGLIARRSRVSADEGNFDNSTVYGISAETNSAVAWSNGSALNCANHSARGVAGAHLYMVGSDTSTSTSVSNLEVNTGGRIDLAGSNIIEGVSGSEANIIAETDGISWLNSFGNNGMVFYNDSTTENYPLLPSSSGITADTGSAQGGSPLISKFNRISVCANVGDSVTMPDAEEGREVIIVNDGANACDVFPASGDRLDSAATDTAVSLAAGGRITYIAYNTARWVSI